MKLNVILVFRAINSIKLQGIHSYIIDIYVSGNEGVKMRRLTRSLTTEVSNLWKISYKIYWQSLAIQLHLKFEVEIKTERKIS